VSEWVFHLSVYLLGLSWSLPVRPRLGAAACCVQAYPIGLALWVAISTLLILAPILLTRGALLGVIALLTLIGAGLSVRAQLRASESGWSWIWTVVGSSALFASALWLVTSYNLTIWTNDSQAIVAIGQSLLHYGEIESAVGPEFASRGLFQAMVHGQSILFDEPYFTAVPVVQVMTMAGALLILGLRGLCGPGRISIPAAALATLAIAAMATPYFMLVQTFYVHETYASAIYLFLAAACLWFAEVERNPLWLPFAFAYALAFSLQRVETPLIAIMLLGMAIVPSRLPRRALNWGLFSYLVPTLIWLAIVFQFRSAADHHQIRGTSHVLEPASIAAIAAGLLAATAGILSFRHPRMAGLRALAPRLIVILMGVALLIASLIRPDFVLQGLTSTAINMTSLSWGGIWYAFFLLGLMSLVLRPLPNAAILSLVPVAILAFILLLSSQQRFEVRWADSGNRMLTQVIPLFSFYLLLIYGRAGLGDPAEVAALTSGELEREDSRERRQ
jgi:hypothetical protein